MSSTPISVSVYPMWRLRLRIPCVAILVSLSDYSPRTNITHLTMLIWSDSLIISIPPTSFPIYREALGAVGRSLRCCLYRAFSGVSRFLSFLSDHGENFPGNDIFLCVKSFMAMAMVSGLASIYRAIEATKNGWSFKIVNCFFDWLLLSIWTPR